MKKLLAILLALNILLLTACTPKENITVSESSTPQESTNTQNEETVEVLGDPRTDPLEVRQQRLLDSIVFSTEDGAYNVNPEYCTLEDIERIINEPEHQLVLSYDEAIVHWVESDLGQEDFEFIYQYHLEADIPETGFVIEKVTKPNGEFYYIVNDEIYFYPNYLRIEPESFMIGELDIYGIMFYFVSYVGELRGGFTICSYGDSPTPLL
jgi:hypothetical protein